MAFRIRRAELVAEMAQLQSQQLESRVNATFCGWTPAEEAAHQKRSDRLALVVRELDTVDGNPP